MEYFTYYTKNIMFGDVGSISDNIFLYGHAEWVKTRKMLEPDF